MFTARREVRGAYQTLFARWAGAQDVSGAGGGRPDDRVTDGSCAAESSSAVVSYRPSRNPASRMPRRWSSISRRRAVPADAAHRPHASAARAHGVAGPADHRRLAVSERGRCGARRLLPAAAAAGSQHRVRRSDQRMFASVCQRAQYRGMTGVSVGRLWQYPVKSMQGEEVDEILLGTGWSGRRSRIRIRRRRNRQVGQREETQALRRAARLPREIPHPAHRRRRCAAGRGHLSRRRRGAHRR